MHRIMMSEMEKLNIQQLIRAEELCAKKVQTYLGQTRDPAIHGILQQKLDRGQRHISSLNSLLQEAGLNGGAGH
ncbi:MAG: hypothetical protein ACOY46_01620 [Bacillota bacterium]